jgi:hypothetical protein
MAGTAAPPSQVFPVLINGVVEVRHVRPAGQAAPGTSPTGTSCSTDHHHLQP